MIEVAARTFAIQRQTVANRHLFTGMRHQRTVGLINTGVKNATAIGKLTQNSGNLCDISAIIVAVHQWREGKRHLSGERLSKLFHHESGMTITDYLIRVRIDKAKQMLEYQADMKVFEVAERVGYADPAYFNKLFKKMTGETPKDYKGKHR